MQNKIVVTVVLILALIGAAFCVLVLSASVMTYPIAVDLPQRVINPPLMMRQPPPPIDLHVDADNRVYWNNSPVDVNELQQKMEEEVQKDPANQPELRIDANPDSGYEVMTRILAQARNAGVKKIGFAQ